MIEISESPRWKLGPVDWKKIGRGALVGATGAALVYLAQYLAGVDFGAWTPAATVVGGVLANTGRKLMQDNNSF